MTLQEIYTLALQMGMEADPRGLDHVKKILVKTKKEHEELSEKKKKYFDEETFQNPYSDSRVLFGDLKTPVKKVLAGIDADAAAILLADRLNEKGEGIDMVITHHPSGGALASLHQVMDMQIDVYSGVGIPENVADALIRSRISEVERRFHPINHGQTIDAARLLNMPLLGLHTIWDNIGDKFVKDYLAKKEFETVGELYEYLMEIPEFHQAKKEKAGPLIVSGNEKSRAGKIVVFFTGGTNPSKEMYVEMAKAGVGTVIDMHMPEETIKEMQKLHVNVINTGHMSSDSIGANIFLDALEKQGVKVISFGGLIRVKRS